MTGKPRDVDSLQRPEEPAGDREPPKAAHGKARGAEAATHVIRSASQIAATTNVGRRTFIAPQSGRVR
jgi:hypothetical protein